MTEYQICNALVRLGSVFDCRRYLCCPNVSHGWNLNYEADLIAITASGYATEVEIKVTSADLRADRHKDKWRIGLGKRIKLFYYAVPDALVSLALREVDQRFGVIGITADTSWEVDGEAEFSWQTGRPRFEYCQYPMRLRASVVRKALVLPDHRKCTEAEVRGLVRLAAIRYWELRLHSR